MLASRIETPLQRLTSLSQELDIELWVKRDDLTAIPGGGSKIRKLVRIIEQMPEDTDAVVTTGAVQSNHARVVALTAAARGLHCELILHGDPEDLKSPTGNLLLMLLSGAKVSIVPSDLIGATITSAMERLRAEGRKPTLIQGGGHSVEGALGLADAILELDAQRPSRDWIPDYIVHASGTGGTQAGLLVGLDLVGWKTHVIGISVARNAARGKAVVENLYQQLRAVLKVHGAARTVDFRDDWIGVGYGKPLPGTEELIRHVMSREGMPLDPTYTSKAMRALIGLVRRGEISRGSRVLFWHTGGLLNLLSARLEWGGPA